MLPDTTNSAWAEMMRKRPRLFALSLLLLALLFFGVNHIFVVTMREKSFTMVSGGSFMLFVGLNCIIFPDHLKNLSGRKIQFMEHVFTVAMLLLGCAIGIYLWYFVYGPMRSGT